MKKTAKNQKPFQDEMAAEYNLAAMKSRPNVFAATRSEGIVKAVILDPDVAEVFKSSAEVNNALRALMNAVPKPSHRRSQPRKTRAAQAV